MVKYKEISPSFRKIFRQSSEKQYKIHDFGVQYKYHKWKHGVLHEQFDKCNYILLPSKPITGY